MSIIVNDLSEALKQYSTSATPTKSSAMQSFMINQNTALQAVATLLNSYEHINLQRLTAYTVGQIVYSPNLPSNLYLVCITAGTTGATEPDFTNISGGGSSTTIQDGTVEWKVVTKTNKEYVDDLVATASNIYRIPLTHGAGLFNFSVTNGTGVAWKLASGAVSYSTTQNLTLPAGTSYLYCNNLWASGVQVSAGSTGKNFTGDLSSFSNLTYSLILSDSSRVTGNLSSLSNLTYYLGLYGCSRVTGNLSSLSNLTNFLSLGNCSLVTGVLSPKATLAYINLSYTGVSSADLDTSISNLNAITTTSGTLKLSGLTRSSASTTDINALINKGWEVIDATVVG